VLAGEERAGLRQTAGVRSRLAPPDRNQKPETRSQVLAFAFWFWSESSETRSEAE
jgi:hypothetical protein